MVVKHKIVQAFAVVYMQIFAIKTPLIKPKDDLVTVLLETLQRKSLELENRDVLAISSKAVASGDGRVVELKTISPSRRAVELAKKYSLEPEFAELVWREADRIYGGVEKTILTLKNSVLTVNAGVDHKNVPAGFAAVWPLNPQRRAEQIRKEIKKQTGKDVGILIIDSTVAPLRMGTRGMAIGVAGFKPVKDCRWQKDLFKKPLLITRHAVADDLASAAHLVMGEADEATPVALIRGAPVTFVESVCSEEMKIDPEGCVYMKPFGLR